MPLIPLPCSYISFKAYKAASTLPCRMLSVIFKMSSGEQIPNASMTCSYDISPSQYETHISASERVSRALPCPACANATKASCSYFLPMPSKAFISSLTSSSMVSRRKSNRIQRDKMVAGIFCTSVVASIKMTCSGGSSNVFNSALNAAAESICTSSTIYTLYLATAGIYLTLSRKLRISSTPLLEAASISKISRLAGLESSLHTSHSPQGEPSLRGLTQFTALAKILATDVLPVPREPVNRYACEMFPLLS